MDEICERPKKSINIEKTKQALDIFRKSCPELFELGQLKYFHFFYCPISVALVDADEYIREEYESLELLVLKLYDAGLTSVDAICKVTGLHPKLVIKTLQLLKKAYRHIEDERISELGRLSINEGIKHVVYEVKKEIQFEAITGTVLDREIEQRKDKLLKGLDPNYSRPLAIDTVELDEEVARDISERLNEYKNTEKSVFDKNIKRVRKVTTNMLRYTPAYAVAFDYMPEPFIILRGRSFSKTEKRSALIWKPTAISQANAEILQERNVDIMPYNVRAEHHFDYLKEVIDGFHIDDEEIEVVQQLVKGDKISFQVQVHESEVPEEFTGEIELEDKAANIADFPEIVEEL